MRYESDEPYDEVKNLENYLAEGNINSALLCVSGNQESSDTVKAGMAVVVAKKLVIKGRPQHIGNIDEVIEQLMRIGAWQYKYIEEVIKGLNIDPVWPGYPGVDVLNAFLLATDWPIDALDGLAQQRDGETKGLITIQKADPDIDIIQMAATMQYSSMIRALMRAGLMVMKSKTWAVHPKRLEFLWLCVEREQALGVSILLSTWMKYAPVEEASQVMAQAISGKKFLLTREHILGMTAQHKKLAATKIVQKALLLHPDQEVRIRGNKLIGEQGNKARDAGRVL